MIFQYQLHPDQSWHGFPIHTTNGALFELQLDMFNEIRYEWPGLHACIGRDLHQGSGRSYQETHMVAVALSTNVREVFSQMVSVKGRNGYGSFSPQWTRFISYANGKADTHTVQPHKLDTSK